MFLNVIVIVSPAEANLFGLQEVKSASPLVLW
ncbi:Uncharacterised protein [Klebsiella pneumoniae]|uniref:Uncharacterized protein n=1 Tax=Klebsiella pneumoniae TaxID=573 RepID=A0A377VVF4_KLEPN|nr:Uncharacterised protein [Klebsiella pneumoniae]